MSKIYEALQRAEQMGSSPSGHLREPVAASSAVSADLAAGGHSFLDFATSPWNPNTDSLPALAETGPLLEQFRSLRSRLYEAQLETPLKTVVISSGSPLEGKTFVTTNLAISLARNSERSVLLIDGDMRRSSIHRLLGFSNGPGLSDYLSGLANLQSIVLRGSQILHPEKNNLPSLSNLAFIRAGSVMANCSELITNHRFEELIASVSSTFDWILIDSPPVGAVSDAVDLARAADGVLLVMRQGKSSGRIVQQTCSAFSNSRLLGLVFNDVPHPPRPYYYSSYVPEQSSKPSRRKQAQRLE